MGAICQRYNLGIPYAYAKNESEYHLVSETNIPSKVKTNKMGFIQQIICIV